MASALVIAGAGSFITLQAGAQGFYRKLASCEAQLVEPVRLMKDAAQHHPCWPYYGFAADDGHAAPDARGHHQIRRTRLLYV
jgi:hypothetical protein